MDRKTIKILGIVVLVLVVVVGIWALCRSNNQAEPNVEQPVQEFAFEWVETPKAEETGFWYRLTHKRERDFVKAKQEYRNQLESLQQQKARLVQEWQIVSQRADDADIKAANEAKYKKYLAEINTNIDKLSQEIKDNESFDEWWENKHKKVMLASFAIAVVFFLFSFLYTLDNRGVVNGFDALAFVVSFTYAIMSAGIFESLRFLFMAEVFAFIEALVLKH